MNNRLIENIHDAEHLELLYREDKKRFEQEFAEVSGQFDTDLVSFWKIRLAKEQPQASGGFFTKDLAIMVGISLLTAILVKMPKIFPTITEEFFYMRDVPWIVLNGIILYTFWVNRIFVFRQMLGYAILLLTSVAYINLIPDIQSDSTLLAIAHLPLLLWCFWGLTWMSFDYKDHDKRMDFIRFNGEVVIMTGLILLAGGLLTAITLSLFSAIGMEISKFYIEYIALSGAVASPVVSFFLIRLYPDVTRKVAPVIARVFTPIVLISLVVYLISLIFSKISILENREFLIIFNAMLIAVLAIIIFSISELDKDQVRNKNVLVLFILAVLALIINSIALVAITSRLFYGITPNRIAVLTTNVLVFINLAILAGNLYQSYYKGASLKTVEASVGKYLTVYALWTVFAVFILPLIFWFR